MATSKLVSELVINQLTAAQYWQAKERGEIKADELYLVVPDAEHVEMTWENITNKPALYTKTESDERYQPKGTYLTAVPSAYQTTAQADDKYATKTEVGDIGALLDEINGGTA